MRFGLILFLAFFTLVGCSTLPPAERKELSTENDSPRYLRYIVQKGDTFWKISQMAYNDSRKWSRIYKANNDKIKDIRDLKPGEILLIPLE